MEQVYNPYLPLNEYVPDGEPHLFGDRVYMYGSHDAAGGTKYCEGHYVTWSAPANNLKDWKYEGVIYRRTQDPSNADDKMQLWAPDATQGPDGKYYLYYCFSFYPEIGVAVSDSPAGPFEFYGHVKYPDSINGGKVLKEFMPFDPAVLTDDDGRVFLYYGFAPGGEKQVAPPSFTDEEIAQMPKEQQATLKNLASIKFSEGAMVAELEPDMVTLKEVPHELIPGENKAAGTSFAGHGFFEASSIRKFSGKDFSGKGFSKKYYFVYSSHKSHELCYATSDKPDSGFVYGGTIVSNGDIGLDGNTVPVQPMGNNHGGIEKIDGKYYIFYHRQTDGTEFSRQGCAEEITMENDGSIRQVEMTSCGLNGGALAASGSYPAGIACYNRCKNSMNVIDYSVDNRTGQTIITESQNVSYVTGVMDGSVLGYKYFEFSGASSADGASGGASAVMVELRGNFKGSVSLATDPAGAETIGKLALDVRTANWSCYLVPISDVRGKKPLYFLFQGTGTADFKGFAFLAG